MSESEKPTHTQDSCEDNVTCLACKHASVAHISTHNFFFVSDDTVSLGPEQGSPENADVIFTKHRKQTTSELLQHLYMLYT